MRAVHQGNLGDDGPDDRDLERGTVDPGIEEQRHDDHWPRVDKLLYTPAEGAQMLSVPESWLRRRAGEGDVPCTRVGRYLRFSRADLEAIAGGEGTGTPRTPPTPPPAASPPPLPSGVSRRARRR
jgi:excisionase family DNA binding protein